MLVDNHAYDDIMMLIDHLVDDDDDDNFSGKSCSKHGKIGWGQHCEQHFASHQYHHKVDTKVATC